LLDVAIILSNSAPTGPADLQAIVLNCLDHIAGEIKTSNVDIAIRVIDIAGEN
jgi:hypothetical protein